MSSTFEDAVQAALRQTWLTVDPYRPSGQPGSYARGYYHGVVDTLKQFKLNYDEALLQLTKEPKLDEGPLVWESVTPYFRRFITDARYSKSSPGIQKWYRPVCARCNPNPHRETEDDQQRRLSLNGR